MEHAIQQLEALNSKMQEQVELVELLAAAVEQMPHAIIVVKSSGEIVYMNAHSRASHDLEGRDPQTIDELYSMYTPLDPRTGNTIVRNDIPIYRALNNETVLGNQFIIDAYSEQHLYISSAKPIYNSDNSLLGAIAVYQRVSGCCGSGLGISVLNQGSTD